MTDDHEGLPPEITVLHVDDERDVAELTVEFLERIDDRLDVEVETSASEALDRLDDRPFDCVVSDYDMPEFDGIEFLESVRERDERLPFVLFTSCWQCDRLYSALERTDRRSRP